MEETPGYWEATIDPRPRYRLCRAGFSIAALAYALFAVDGFGFAVGIIRRERDLLRFLASPFWDWAVNTPITWGTFLGSCLLVGRFSAPVWRNRILLLVVMNTVDVFFWGIEHGEALGLPRALNDLRGGYYLWAISPLLNLAQVTLYAGLAGDLLEHLGESDEASQRMRGVWLAAGLAAFFWIGFQWHLWRFPPGQAPRFRWRRGPQPFQLLIASSLAQAATYLMISLLCARAALLSAKMLIGIDAHEKQTDPFRSRSELE